MSRAIILVNYRSAALLEAAISSARAASSVPLEVVVVDNSCDPEEAAALNRISIDHLIVSSTNRGYAGGLNDGIGATRAEELVLSNPDVVFWPQSIDRLLNVAAQTSIAGPRFVWDVAGTVTLPPATLPTLTTKRLEVLSLRYPALRSILQRRAVRQRVAFFRRTAAAKVASLSGAVMAMSRRVHDRLGPFDERYALYFEESDYFMHARVSRVPVRYVPTAVCRHLYNQSASSEERTAQLFAESEQRYFEKWYGRSASRAMHSAPPIPVAEFELTSDRRIVVDPDNDVVELSPSPWFPTAGAALPVDESFVIPEEVLETLRTEWLYVRVVSSRSGAVRRRLRLRSHATIPS